MFKGRDFPLFCAILDFDIYSREPNELRLSFGTNFLGESPYPLSKNEIRMDVAEIVVHPEFRP